MTRAPHTRARRLDALRARQLAQHDRLERQPGQHARPRPARELERARERDIPVDVAGRDGDPAAALRDQLHQVRGRGHEREAVQDDAPGREHVEVRDPDRVRVAPEVLGREPGGVAGAAGARRLAVVADLREREGARPVYPRRLEIGARGERERAQIRQAADANARQALAVEGAPPRAGDGGVE